MTMPSTSPMAQPVRQCAVAVTAIQVSAEPSSACSSPPWVGGCVAMSRPPQRRIPQGVFRPTPLAATARDVPSDAAIAAGFPLWIRGFGVGECRWRRLGWCHVRPADHSRRPSGGAAVCPVGCPVGPGRRPGLVVGQRRRADRAGPGAGRADPPVAGLADQGAWPRPPAGTWPRPSGPPRRPHGWPAP